ncbi:MAG: hypothetical protein KGL02_02710 [Acidobacteriota bacterium]|nr:hypothetical protein [Acidobacteriota bacterium]MDE3171342.1 hypothetical protein [Acidobacteriota bacterium]
MQRTAQSLVLGFVIGLFACQPALAYQSPLSPEAVREAYFLGKANASQREDFFARYTRNFRAPKSGPYISLIRVITPYAFVVERTAQLQNLLAPDAQQQFYGKPIAIRIRVHIDLTPTYSWQVRSPHGGVALRREDFWRDFTVRLIQRTQTIQPLNETGEPIYSFAGRGEMSVLVGADIDVQYDPEQVRSGPATVVVNTPDGQQISANFDLSKVR